MAKHTDPATYVRDGGLDDQWSWEDPTDPEGGLLHIGVEDNGTVYIVVNDQHVVELPPAVAALAANAINARVDYLTKGRAS